MLCIEHYVFPEFASRLSTTEDRAKLRQELNPEGLADYQIRTRDDKTFSNLSRHRSPQSDLEPMRTSDPGFEPGSPVLYALLPPRPHTSFNRYRQVSCCDS